MPWSSDYFLVLPKTAIAFAWSAPMRELAARIGISDVALRKLLTGQGVVIPPQGHWNRVHAGRAVIAPPLPRPRRPGESGRIRLDGRFRGHVAEAGAMPEEGPFASKEVPEDLAALRAQELAKIGGASAPRDLTKAHFGLAKLLSREEARRAKAAASRWAWDEPHFDAPLARRQLRILSGLFSALGRRDHSAQAWEDDNALRATCTIGETSIRLKFTPVGRHRTETRDGRQHPARDLPAATPLRIELTYALRAAVTSAWQDEPGRPLEQQLADIAADLIVAGEASFRQSLVEAREHAERMRRWQEEAERKRLEELNRERLACLESSGALLRQADDLRALVERVARAVASGGLELGAGEFETWREWALARADELDPVLSGQVLGHIRPVP